MADESRTVDYTPAVVVGDAQAKQAQGQVYWALELQHDIVFLFAESAGEGYVVPKGSHILIGTGYSKNLVLVALVATSPSPEVLEELTGTPAATWEADLYEEQIPF